ncbi:MAG: hypothetical protein Q4G33_00930 [bacterium]|nr:hypothetical protein [bacterium]
MDKIVFEQSQLDELLPNGTMTVVLCDNNFVIPLCRDVRYSAIGDVKAEIACSRAEAGKLGIVFENFSPEFIIDDTLADEPPIYANVPHGIHPAVPGNTDYGLLTAGASFASSFASSFAISFVSSFASSFSGSFNGSFYGMYEYEYEYEGGSFPGSFSSSFRAGMSFFGSSASVMRLREKYVVREIAVNGYGLNLI